MPDNPTLDIVNEDGHITGQENRDIIHKKGLLHQEIHVFFYTPDKHIIFQHRAKDKETFPDLLDATAGGHVEIDQDDLSAAVQETLEETSLQINHNQLKLLRTIRDKAHDPITNTTNNVIRPVYSYRFTALLSDLKLTLRT